ncbi:hypothetical protein RHMOL_Rhmol13G0136400 [Rhododendron molle]|uniref:Uncharacterized protein n=1 Tax=Rhododendron molle TaxID=49168 RepID=A0ACC0L6V5_RHOML|nr:hypothetical protein RHMOL_Rhmol13G0136400 [Rhododendron molle]
MENPEKFSSFRGVAFEIKPHVNPFDTATTPIATAPTSGSKRYWVPWGSSSRIFTSFNAAQRSVSRNSSHLTDSSHFCDLEFDDEDEEDLYPQVDHEDLYPPEDEEYSSRRILCMEDGPMQEELNRVSFSELPLVKSKREQTQKPNRPKESRLSVILLDQGLFTVYKQLFVICLTLNITILVLSATGNFQYAKNKAALFSIGNILALTFCRSELCLRIVFYIVVKVFGRSWVPFCIKTTITSLLQSLGGIHSACGISSIAWIIYALVLTLRDRENTSPEIIAVASAILSLLSLSSLAAFPLVRHLHHNIFERTHRFAGWTALALIWAFILLTITYDPKTKTYNSNLFSRLIRAEEVWLTTATTVLIIIPWVTVRRVKVNVSAPSNHTSIIKFEGGVRAGLLGRISPSPLSEWHAFGIISNGKKEHMMLASAVGDFTSSLVSSPPSHLWVRTVHFAGLPYLLNMYDKVLVVATGSGLCVYLSFLLQPCAANIYLLWVAKGIERNFGKEVKEWVGGYPKEKVIIHDTTVHGRPNVSKMSVDAARNWGVEVVVVTSNPEGSRDVVNACKAAGICAFGPIWDS